MEEVKALETEACSLTGNSGSDRQPAKLSEYWSDCEQVEVHGLQDGLHFLILLSLLTKDRGGPAKRDVMVNA